VYKRRKYFIGKLVRRHHGRVLSESNEIIIMGKIKTASGEKWSTGKTGAR